MRLFVPIILIAMLTACGSEHADTTTQATEESRPAPLVQIGTERYCDGRNNTITEAGLYSNGTDAPVRMGTRKVGGYCDAERFEVVRTLNGAAN